MSATRSWRCSRPRNATQVASYQAVYRHYGNPECRGGIRRDEGHEARRNIRNNEQVGEWMQVQDGKIAVTGSMRWFAQQFPVEWQARPDRLTLQLWSPRGGELDFGERGIKDSSARRARSTCWIGKASANRRIADRSLLLHRRDGRR